jgi:hypothetical protein
VTFEEDIVDVLAKIVFAKPDKLIAERLILGNVVLCV